MNLHILLSAQAPLGPISFEYDAQNIVAGATLGLQDGNAIGVTRRTPEALVLQGFEFGDLQFACLFSHHFSEDLVARGVDGLRIDDATGRALSLLPQ